MPQLVFSQNSPEKALEIVRRGIESHHVSHLEYWDASQELLKTAQANLKFIIVNKNIIITEIEKLDQWDSFSEISGDYMVTLIKTLIGLSDPSLTQLFLRECKHGSFVSEGLANIGRPALDSILDEVGGKYSTCAVIALRKMAEKKLASNSDLQADQSKMLKADFGSRVLPRLEVELTSSIARGDSVSVGIIKRALSDINGIIK
jgi:hypothetical protein